MDFENMNIWCWIIPLLVGLISALLGYLIGKMNGDVVEDHSADIKRLEDQNAQLRADLTACNDKLTAKATAKPAAKKKTRAPKTKVAAMATDPVFDAATAKAVFGKRIKKDDLKIVEGIGPKIEGLFHNFDIKTWKALSEASAKKCQEVLDSGGERYRMHDPKSWPRQAKMAYKGEWKKLAKWQDEHKGGKL